MIFKEFGNIKDPTIILLHGGGLSYWSLENVISLLTPEYHVVTPIIDGYGEYANETFLSIENSANHLIGYVTAHYNGHVFALGGLSIGAQIVTEILSKQTDIADFAIIESALVCPIRGTKLLTLPMCRMSYGLVKKRWFSKLQAKQLCVPETLFERYYTDSIKMSKQSLVNIILSNGTYKLKVEIKDTKAKTLIIVGEKEIAAEKKSAEILQRAISNSRLYIAPKMKHGELSLTHPEQFVEQLKLLFSK
jgi:pimeloyl-ACP methyl ester carboxylesterase